MRLKQVNDLEFKVRFYTFPDKVAFIDFMKKLEGKWKVRTKRIIWRYDSPVANRCHIGTKYAYIRLMDEHEKERFLKAWEETFKDQESSD